MEPDSLPAASVPHWPSYDFHDEKFVTWWLNSLYLFAPQDQLAIAQLLRDAVHAPEAAREIEAFLAIRTQAVGDSDGQTAGQPAPGAGAGVGGAGGIVRSIAQIWYTSRWTAALGLCAVAFFLAKGLWFVMKSSGSSSRRWPLPGQGD